MILLDTNVILAAHRADHPHHAMVAPWFEDVLDKEERFTVPSVVWASFIRIATNRRIFEVPTPVDDAFGFLRAVIAQPNYASTTAGSRHLELFEKMTREGDAIGDLAADAYLAALALELGCELVSLDRDFARFPSLIWRRPEVSGN